MSKREKAEILEKMRLNTAKVLISQAHAINYLIELGALTKRGNYPKHYRPSCIKSKAD